MDKQPSGQAVLSWKLDGLTLVLRYSNGVFKQAITRGDGQVGEDVTHNIWCVSNIPSSILSISVMSKFVENASSPGKALPQ